MIAIASDHAGYPLKQEIKLFLDSISCQYKDFGAFSAESCDYAEFAFPAARAVAEGKCEKAILVCGTGVGVMLTANKVRGIRCVLCSDSYTAALSRRHNDANALAMGARVVGPGLAREIVDVWLKTPFEGGRHQRRVAQITQIEESGKL